MTGRNLWRRAGSAQNKCEHKNLAADVRGEIEVENKVLVIRRIHVVYHIIAPAEARETIERIHRIHADHCPVYRSLYKAIEISTEYRLKNIS